MGVCVVPRIEDGNGERHIHVPYLSIHCSVIVMGRDSVLYVTMAGEDGVRGSCDYLHIKGINEPLQNANIEAEEQVRCRTLQKWERVLTIRHEEVTGELFAVHQVVVVPLFPPDVIRREKNLPLYSVGTQDS